MKQHPTRLRVICTGFALLLSLCTSSCGRDSTPAAVSRAAPPPTRQPYIPGADAYREGQAALSRKDADEALRLFRQATRHNKDLAEAWYGLGRVQVTLAVGLIKSDELLALQVFREGLQAEREALRLMDEGNVSIWSAEEQEQARAVLDADLQGADEALSDPDSLAQALRLRVY